MAHHEPVLQTGACVATGFADIDAIDGAHAGGGLPCGGLHEVAAGSAADMAAALGFAHRLAARFLHHAAEDDVLLYGQTHAACAMAVSPMARLWRRMVCPRKSWSISMALPCRIYYGPVSRRCCASVACSLLASSRQRP